MSNEPNKPIPARELTEKELEGIEGIPIRLIGTAKSRPQILLI